MRSFRGFNGRRNEHVSKNALRIDFSGLQFEEMPGDGHCFFRAIAMHLDFPPAAYRDNEPNGHVFYLRNQVADYIENNITDFQDIIDHPRGIGGYLQGLRNGSLWGGDLEIGVIQTLYHRPIVVVFPDAAPLVPDNIRGSDDPIFIYYNGESHYDALVIEEGFNPRQVLNAIMPQTDEDRDKDEDASLDARINLEVHSQNGRHLLSAPVVAVDEVGRSMGIQKMAKAVNIFGEYMIVQQANAAPGDPRIYASLFNSNHYPLFENILISPEPLRYNDYPSVIANDSGDFLVFWVSHKVAELAYDDEIGLFRQKISRHGSFIGSADLVSENNNNFPATAGAIYNNAVAKIDNGNICVIYVHAENGNSEIRMRRMNANGSVIGNEISINGTTEVESRKIYIVNLDNDLLISWVVPWSISHSQYLQAIKYNEYGSALTDVVNLTENQSSELVPAMIKQANNSIATVCQDGGDVVLTNLDDNLDILNSPIRLMGTKLKMAVDLHNSFISISYFDNEKIYSQFFSYSGIEIESAFEVASSVTASSIYELLNLSLPNGRLSISWIKSNTYQSYSRLFEAPFVATSLDFNADYHQYNNQVINVFSNPNIISPTETVTVAITLSDSNAGSFNSLQVGTASLYYDAQTETYQITGNTVDVVSLLQQLTFTIAADYDVNFTGQVVVSNGGINAPLVFQGVFASLNDLPQGEVRIIGEAKQNQQLTADISNLSDADGINNPQYDWYHNNEIILGAAGATYTLTQDDVGTAIHCKVSYMDNKNNEESLLSAITSNVVNVNDAPTGTVTIEGNLTQGQTLSVNTSQLFDADGLGILQYQWLRNNAVIPNAMQLEYILTQGDVGFSISVRVSYTDLYSTAENVLATATTAVVNVNDAPTGTVTIDGDPRQGQILSVNTNLLSDLDGLGVLHYQWFRNNAIIPNETQSEYILTQADVGFSISVQVSYTDLYNTAETVLAQASTAIVNVNDTPTGTVTIEGDLIQGQTLSVNTDPLSDLDGLGPLQYQWLRNNVMIPNATQSQYVLTQADVGFTISIRVSYTDLYSNAENVLATATTAVVNVNDTPTGTITIEGNPTQGQTLTVNTNPLSDLDGLGVLHYQWLRNNATIPNATQSEYTLTQADVGFTISVRVSYTDLHNTAENVWTTATTAIVNVNDVPTGTVTIDGAREEDAILTVNTSNLVDVDGIVEAFSYRWFRDDVTIEGATNEQYRLVEADVGKRIHVEVSYVDQGGQNEQVNSSATQPIGNINNPPSGSVTISGDYTQGQQLLAVTDSIMDPDGNGDFSFQWLRNDQAIPGATVAHYTLVEADVDHTIRVRVSYQDLNGSNEVLLSDATDLIANINDDPTGTITIEGNPTQGQTLSVNTSQLFDDDGLGNLQYQWLRNNEIILNATQLQYVLTQADVGQNISVRVSYIDNRGAHELVESLQTLPIVNVNDRLEGKVMIEGSVLEGQILTANTDQISDIDGLGVFSFQWRRDGQDIIDATEKTYQLIDADVGSQISVRVSYQDGGQTLEITDADPTEIVGNINNPHVGSLDIVGDPIEGQELIAQANFSDADGVDPNSYQHQWYRDGNPIDQATNDRYTLQQADVGTKMSVIIRYQDKKGTNEKIESSLTIEVRNIPSPSSGSVTIDGIYAQHKTLTANTNNLTDIDGIVSWAYQWMRDGQPITGATKKSYELTAKDVDKRISVNVTYKDQFGDLTGVSSSVTEVIVANHMPTGTLRILGQPIERKTLRASTDSLRDLDGPANLQPLLTYAWLRDGNIIPGANGDTYILTANDVGARITLRVSYQDQAGILEEIESEATSKIERFGKPRGKIKITGVKIKGHSLTCDISELTDADGFGSGEPQYQWLRDNVEISGATNPSYVLAEEDVGHEISVRFSYQDGADNVEQVISAATVSIILENKPPVGELKITGKAFIGETLTADLMALSDENEMLEPIDYQWQRDSKDIIGATDKTYVLTPDDIGRRIGLRIRYYDQNETLEKVETELKERIMGPNGYVVIKGEMTEDEILTATIILPENQTEPHAIHYQWFRDGEIITSVTSKTYRLGDHDVGKQIQVKAAYTNDNQEEVELNSATTIKVKNVNDMPEGGVTIDIDGDFAIDATLTANTDALTDADGIVQETFSYEWRRDGNPISGATQKTYKIQAADLDKSISVNVMYTDFYGKKEKKLSAERNKNAGIVIASKKYIGDEKNNVFRPACESNGIVSTSYGADRLMIAKCPGNRVDWLDPSIEEGDILDLSLHSDIASLDDIESYSWESQQLNYRNINRFTLFDNHQNCTTPITEINLKQQQWVQLCGISIAQLGGLLQFAVSDSVDDPGSHSPTNDGPDVLPITLGSIGGFLGVVIMLFTLYKLLFKKYEISCCSNNKIKYHNKKHDESSSGEREAQSSLTETAFSDEESSTTDEGSSDSKQDLINSDGDGSTMSDSSEDRGDQYSDDSDDENDGASIYSYYNS